MVQRDRAGAHLLCRNADALGPGPNLPIIALGRDSIDIQVAALADQVLYNGVAAWAVRADKQRQALIAGGCCRTVDNRQHAGCQAGKGFVIGFLKGYFAFDPPQFLAY